MAKGKPDDLAVAVAAELERRGMSQLQLAKDTGLEQSEVWRWLAGVRSLRSDKVARIFRELGLKVTRAR